MVDVSNSVTSLTLLKRLKVQPTDEQAWREFVTRYGKKIQAWCRHWGLQESDAADVCQTVLLKLAKEMSNFDRRPDGSFRAWLKTVSHHAWYDLVQSRQHKILKGGEHLESRLASEEARDDLVTQMEAAWDQELMELASQRVQLRLAPKTWNAFQLSAVERLSGEEVAARLQMNLASVYKAKSNVLRLLQQEVQSLERSEFA